MSPKASANCVGQALSLGDELTDNSLRMLRVIDSEFFEK